MLTAVFSLTGALVFGAADFLGGLAARRMSAVLATAFAALAGFVALGIALPLLGGGWAPHDVLWGAISGVAGAVAISLLYASLAIGPMSILSPLTAVVSAIVPMAWGLIVAGERLAELGYWALALALLAVVLVGFVPERGAVRPSLTGLLLGAGSGIAIGAFYVAIDQTSDESGAVPLLLNRGVTAAIMFAVAGVIALVALRRRGTDARAERRGLAGGIRLAIACGVVDVVANGLLIAGIRAGDLSVAAVLGAMYPAGTIILAAIVLKERIAPVQWLGLALALGAAAMFALA